MGPLRLRRRAERGFTLVEVLVVVAILAIATGVATLVLERDERAALSREARRLGGALEYAAARARMRSETLGVSAEDGAWRFWIRNADGGWLPVSGDDALAAHALAAPIGIRTLSYAGAAVDSEVIVPFRASGRNEPFALTLAAPGWQVVVSMDLANRVAVEGPRPEAP